MLLIQCLRIHSQSSNSCPCDLCNTASIFLYIFQDDKEEDACREDIINDAMPKGTDSSKTGEDKMRKHVVTERIYKCHILDSSRNKDYMKIVHDTRNGESHVYGETDDMIVSVNETKNTYSSWATHDRDKRSDEIYSLIQKWPSANKKNCDYGMFAIRAVLPDIKKQHQEHYSLEEEDT